MSLTLALVAPTLLLTGVVATYLYTVFEPYRAVETDAAAELKTHHGQDMKLRLMAEWWAGHLSGKGDEWYDDDDHSVGRVYDQIHAALVRHRIITGDDPSKLVFNTSGMSRILIRAVSRARLSSTNNAKAAVMIITPSLVKLASGEVIWKGSPIAYKSRFNDMYAEP